MKAIFKKAGVRKPELVEIQNELKELQGKVDGYIEMIPIGDRAVLIVNEEGKLRNLPINFWIGSQGSVLDCIRGDVLICATDGEELCDLSDEQTETFMEMLTDVDVVGLRTVVFLD